MLHIILMILRIVGWILLAVLALLVLVFLFALFTPLRYKIDLGCGGKLSSLKAKVRFHILFHLIDGAVFYEDKKLIWNIRAAWIKLGNSEVPEKAEEDAEKVQESAGETIGKAQESAGETIGKAQESPGETAEKVRESVEKTAEKVDQAVEEAAGRMQESLEEQAEKAAEVVPENTEEKAEETLEAEKKKEEGTSTEEETRARAGEETGAKAESQQSEEQQTLLDKAEAVFEKIKYTFSKICDKIKILSEKAELARAFLENESHQSAFWKLAAELKKLLFRMKPKKLRGNLRFGFEDPSLTGRVQAGLSMLYPYLEEVRFYPDFENQVLDGEVSVQGAARLWPMAAFVWNMVWNRDVRRTVLDLKKRIRK